jgi:hypothetical protein
MRLKRMLNKIFIGLMIFIMLGCVSTTQTTKGQETSSVSVGMDLNEAVKEAASQMETRLPAKTMVALVSLASPSTAFSEQVLTRLESAIVGSGKLVVVDRANLDKIRAEQGFQLSGEVDDDSAKSIGKLLGAGAIVTGSLTDLGEVYSLTLKAINIETATVAVSYLADLAKTTRIETLLASGGGAASTSGASSGRSGASGGAAQSPAAPAYKIGDTGPGGGIVFYDKGNTSGGWRYLEVSKDDLGKVIWGNNRLGMGSDGITGVGTGKQNTQFIAKSGGMAAMLCGAYQGEGFSDWFLPSKDELNLIYINLVRLSHIVDWEDRYWSSSVGNYDAVDGASTGGGAWSQSFGDGSQNVNHKNSEYSVCPVRQF